MREFAFSLGKANEQAQMASDPLTPALKNPLVFCFSRSSDCVLSPIAVDVNKKKNFVDYFILFGAGFALTPSTINSWFIGVASALLLDVTGFLKFC